MKRTVLTVLLYGISSLPRLDEMAFGGGGGTALKKAYFADFRFSEDLDFACTRDESGGFADFLDSPVQASEFRHPAGPSTPPLPACRSSRVANLEHIKKFQMANLEHIKKFQMANLEHIKKFQMNRTWYRKAPYGGANPWWGNPSSIQGDQKIRDWEESATRYVPELLRAIR